MQLPVSGHTDRSSKKILLSNVINIAHGVLLKPSRKFNLKRIASRRLSSAVVEYYRQFVKSVFSSPRPEKKTDFLCLKRLISDAKKNRI